MKQLIEKVKSFFKRDPEMEDYKHSLIDWEDNEPPMTQKEKNLIKKLEKMYEENKNQAN